MATKEVAYFCPECGGASVTFSALAGGVATCKTCNWSGAREQLVAYTFEHGFDGAHDIVIALVGDLRRLVSRDAKEFGRILAKWGFIDPELPSAARQLTRYLAAIARGIAHALVEERTAIEKERVSGN
jgi:hypothetical protein